MWMIAKLHLGGVASGIGHKWRWKIFERNCGKIHLKKNDEGESLFDIIRKIVREEFKIYECIINKLINSK